MTAASNTEEIDLVPVAKCFYDPVKRYEYLAGALLFGILDGLFLPGLVSEKEMVTRLGVGLLLGAFGFLAFLGIIAFLFLLAKGATAMTVNDQRVVFSFDGKAKSDFQWVDSGFCLRFVATVAYFDSHTAYKLRDPKWHNVYLHSEALDTLTTCARAHGICVTETETLGFMGPKRKIVTLERKQ